MLKRLLLFCGALAMGSLSYAQTPQRTCAAQEIHEHKMNTDAKYRAKRQAVDAQYDKFMRMGAQAATGGVRTIPVYVHVIYNTSQENISTAQINSQISVLNEDYRATNSDVSQVPSEFAGSVADYGIEFEIVQITRKQSSRTSWGTNDDMKKSSQGGVNPVTPDTHLNMWVCNIGGGILGYAQFPGGPSSTDGVVMSPQYFGSSDYSSSFYLSAPFDKGRTSTHEVGHYLNLRHIWGDGNCSADDFVSDTPTAGAANYGCPSYPSKSCSSNGGYTSDMFMNYMDYVDDNCMFMFSNGQKTRSDAIFASGGSRENLGYVGSACSLAAPTNLSSSNIGDNQFSLSWNAVSGAASYNVSINGSSTTTSGTTYTATGLTAGTDYTTNVVANCSSGGSGTASSNLVVTTTGSNCNVGPAELTLTFDNYASETSWSLTLDGSQVAAGSGYSNNNSTITEDFDYGDGNYVFTINDAYGDGICCSYGNGSWTIRDASSNVIASGGSFSSSESASYCTEGSGGGDSEAPTAPGNLSSSNITQTSANLSWSASTDNVGVTGYDVLVNGSLDGSTSSTNYAVNGLSAGTTYTMAVRAKDAAGNTSSSSSTNVTTQSAGMSCTSTVSMPYEEGFESSLGAWSQVSGDDFDWSRNSGGTPSSNTGPSSATEGSYYIYVESSSPNNSNDVAIVESPCFDLSGESSANLSFAYHMYGTAAMGGLDLQATTDGSNWTSVWSESGNQGNSWQEATVDLGSYTGGDVKVRFVGTTGTTWQGDMAVDAISLTSTGGGSGTTTVSLSITLDNYPEETSWEIRDGATVLASGGTYGSQPDGSTVTQNIDLADGCYDFVINDAYGDGICCSYGNGSYSLTSSGSTLASGGSFGSSETTNFCVGSGARAGAGIVSSEGTAPAGFSVFPNPASDKITLYTGKMESPNYVIINAAGHVWQQGSLSGNQAEINVSRLQAGFYFVRVTDGENTIVHKVVKQ